MARRAQPHDHATACDTGNPDFPISRFWLSTTKNAGKLMKLNKAGTAAPPAFVVCIPHVPLPRNPRRDSRRRVAP